MARSKKRASMREGPLADLFRSTEESVAAEEIKVTAKTNGGVAVEEPRSGDPHARAGPRADRRSLSPSPPPTPCRSRSRARSPFPSRHRQTPWRTPRSKFTTRAWSA